MPSVPRIDSLEQRRELLRVARANATRASGGADEVTSKIRVPGVFGGAFVTFWGKGKKLRGCVGSFGRTSDIVETIREVTTMSMTDSRFAADPISATELPELDIEVSILSDLELTDDPASLTPGVHGIVVRRGSRSGCFLPKVAAERGWSAEQFLSACCTMKAGLPADAWRDSGVEVLLFTAQVFSESSPA